MKAGFFPLVLLLVSGLGLAGHAAPPLNDSFLRPSLLPGVAGTRAATTVGATAEKDEFSAGQGQTVWFSHNLLLDGFLQITHPLLNQAGTSIELAGYAGAGLVSAFERIPFRSTDTALGTSQSAFPMLRGTNLRLQFDTGNTGINAEPLPGAFTFSYGILTGGGFRFSDPTGFDASQFGPVWRYREGREAVAHITVLRAGGTDGAASVHYTATGLSATAGVDFNDLGTGTLLFAPGKRAGRSTCKS